MNAEIVRRPTMDQRAARRDLREYFCVMPGLCLGFGCS